MFAHEGLKGSDACGRCGRIVLTIGATCPYPSEPGFGLRDTREVVMVAVLRGPSGEGTRSPALTRMPTVGFIVCLFPGLTEPMLEVRCLECNSSALTCDACAGTGCPACCIVCNGEGAPAPMGCPACSCYDAASDAAEEREHAARLAQGAVA